MYTCVCVHVCVCACEMCVIEICVSVWGREEKEVDTRNSGLEKR